MTSVNVALPNDNFSRSHSYVKDRKKKKKYILAENSVLLKTILFPERDLLRHIHPFKVSRSYFRFI